MAPTWAGPGWLLMLLENRLFAFRHFLLNFVESLNSQMLGLKQVLHP